MQAVVGLFFKTLACWRPVLFNSLGCCAGVAVLGRGATCPTRPWERDIAYHASRCCFCSNNVDDKLANDDDAFSHSPDNWRFVVPLRECSGYKMGWDVQFWGRMTTKFCFLIGVRVVFCWPWLPSYSKLKVFLMIERGDGCPILLDG